MRWSSPSSPGLSPLFLSHSRVLSEGRVAFPKAIRPADSSAHAALCGPEPRECLAIEANAHFAWVSRVLRERRHEVIVATPPGSRVSMRRDIHDIIGASTREPSGNNTPDFPVQPLAGKRVASRINCCRTFLNAGCSRSVAEPEHCRDSYTSKGHTHWAWTSHNGWSMKRVGTFLISGSSQRTS